MGGHAVERRLDALQRGVAVLGAAVAADQQHVLGLAVAGQGVAAAQALVDQLAQMVHHRAGLLGVGVLRRGDGKQCQVDRDAKARLHAALQVVDLAEGFKRAVHRAGGVVGGQFLGQAGDVIFQVAVSLAGLAGDNAHALRLDGIMQAAHRVAAAGQLLRFVVAAQGLQRLDHLEVQALLVGVQFNGAAAELDDALVLALALAGFQHLEQRNAVLRMQAQAAELDPGLVAGKRQQTAGVQLQHALVTGDGGGGVQLAAGLFHQGFHLKHVDTAFQRGIPLVIAAAGEDAVLHRLQALGFDHVAEAVHDRAQRHIGVGGTLAVPQGIRQFLVGDFFALLQHQILHQHRGLAGLVQRGKHRLAVHKDLEFSEHPNLNICHGKLSCAFISFPGEILYRYLI